MKMSEPDKVSQTKHDFSRAYRRSTEEGKSQMSSSQGVGRPWPTGNRR